MTSGSSQGLFVVVAVIIFGIFIFIIHLLFRDTLMPSLEDVFVDGLTQTEDALKRKDKNPLKVKQIYYSFLTNSGTELNANTKPIEIGEKEYHVPINIKKSEINLQSPIKSELMIVEDSDGFDYFIINGVKKEIQNKKNKKLTITGYIPKTYLSEDNPQSKNVLQIVDKKGNRYIFYFEINLIP